ncbi:GNAT family N-acetyltransferase [Desertihabitans brevis]|uniref:GNAT family N-acetyltransferase n=1 Tax=Desertihabitans brevis TaxID=2268447 RepID=A0A367YRT7_9ACTN|nr:GNAT family N-acetyltransferase [Desertihabitans brevis]RCK68606.1 GNAT family N-acetyltransferase [Desertihabitans brevis]
MSVEFRELTEDDRRASDALSHEAFGAPRTDRDPEPRPLPPGRHRVGAFVDGRLVAKLGAAEYTSFWGGAELTTAGIGGVTVAVEHRRGGLLRGLFEVGLAPARENGVAVSTLYPTAPAIYRRLGYEVVTDLITVRVPTSSLATLAVPEPVRLRRATEADLPAVRAVYRAWAVGHNGPLSRTGPAFGATDAEVLAEFSGITLAEVDGVCVGYCSFDRGTGYGPEATVEVSDLVATTGEGYLALLASLGSHASVVGSIDLRTSGSDVVRLLHRTSHWQVVSRNPYMLAVLDIPAALSGRRWLPVEHTLELAVEDEAVHGYRLTLDGLGGGVCEQVPLTFDMPVLTRRGLAARYAGSQSCASLRAAGHLRGDDRQDPWLDALFTGEAHVLDHF